MNVRKIKLTRNQYALIDNEDYERINKYKWQCSNGGYAVRNIWKPKRSTIWMHRFVLNTISKKEVDHINSNKLDNQKKNLRLVTHHQNNMNVTKRSNCSSIYKGVSFKKSTGRWYAYIKFNTKRISLGYYDNEVDAASIYNKAAKRLFGKFAKLNLIERKVG